MICIIYDHSQSMPRPSLRRKRPSHGFPSSSLMHHRVRNLSFSEQKPCLFDANQKKLKFNEIVLAKSRVVLYNGNN